MRKAVAPVTIATVAVLLSLAAHKAKSVPPVSTTCQAVGNGANPFRLLVVGESWAAGPKMIPELPLAVSKSMGGRAVQVCGIGYSGANTSKQLVGLERDLGKLGVVKLLGGKPDKIVMLTGINDILQRRGSATYRKDVSRLRNWLSGLSTDLTILELPAINVNSPLALPYELKRSAFMAVDGDSEEDLLGTYRAALHGLPVQVIDYDKFGSDWATRPLDYDAKGIHLTPRQFHRLGVYLGSKL